MYDQFGQRGPSWWEVAAAAAARPGIGRQ